MFTVRLLPLFLEVAFLSWKASFCLILIFCIETGDSELFAVWWFLLLELVGFEGDAADWLPKFRGTLTLKF